MARPSRNEGRTVILTIIDLRTQKKQINPDRILYQKVKIHRLLGWKCQGWPVMTIVGGKIVWEKECISMKRQLILEDGTVLIGKGFGATKRKVR